MRSAAPAFRRLKVCVCVCLCVFMCVCVCVLADTMDWILNSIFASRLPLHTHSFRIDECPPFFIHPITIAHSRTVFNGIHKANVHAPLGKAGSPAAPSPSPQHAATPHGHSTAETAHTPLPNLQLSQDTSPLVEPRNDVKTKLTNVSSVLSKPVLSTFTPATTAGPSQTHTVNAHSHARGKHASPLTHSLKTAQPSSQAPGPS
jgi:hypothetical protein